MKLLNQLKKQLMMRVQNKFSLVAFLTFSVCQIWFYENVLIDRKCSNIKIERRMIL